MNTISDDQSALAYLNAEIERAQRAADAEAAYDAANGREGPNPWANAARALTDLEQDRRQLSLRIEGQKLTKSLQELKRLDEEIAKAQVQREAADRALRERSSHETVQRYLKATSTCMKFGWGHSFTADFRTWYESGKPRHLGLSSSGAFFLDSPQARDAGVSFNCGSDREAVLNYVQALEQANRAMVQWSAHADLRANLLREHPELKSVS